MSIHTMTVRLDDEEKASVVEMAMAMHVSQQQVLRRAVRELAARELRQARLLDAIDRTGVENAEPLRRLGEV